MAKAIHSTMAIAAILTLAGCTETQANAIFVAPFGFWFALGAGAIFTASLWITIRYWQNQLDFAKKIQASLAFAVVLSYSIGSLPGEYTQGLLCVVFGIGAIMAAKDMGWLGSHVSGQMEKLLKRGKSKLTGRAKEPKANQEDESTKGNPKSAKPTSRQAGAGITGSTDLVDCPTCHKKTLADKAKCMRCGKPFTPPDPDEDDWVLGYRD